MSTLANIGTLAQQAAELRRETQLSPKEARAKLRQSIEKAYTLPASSPLPMPGTNAAPTRQEKA